MRLSIRPLRTAGLALLALGPVLIAQDKFAVQRPAAAAAQNAQPIQFSATIFGSFDYNYDGTGAWTGFAVVVLGDGAPKVARFVDRNTSFGMRANGSIYGTETISLRFNDGSGTFDIKAAFEGIPASTPNLFYLFEVGQIVNGTGDYANASGHVLVQGPFLLPNLEATPGAPPWIAEMHGAIDGLNRR